MVCKSAITLTLIFVLQTAVAAMSIQIEGDDSSTPFEATCRNDGHTSCGLVMQMSNDSGSDATVLGWSLVLRLQALEDAAGGLVSFESVQTAPDSLFGTDSSLDSAFDEGGDLVVFDADTSFLGQIVPPDEHRNIARLLLGLEPDTVGQYLLLMREFSPADESGSSWFDAEAGPQAFTNSAASGLAEYVLLGTIEVLLVPEPSSAALWLVAGLFLAVAALSKK
jgi:hypothetical protein